MALPTNHSQLVILIDDTKVMNEPRDIFFFFASIPLLVIAVTVNLWAGWAIARKERTGIHNIIVCDCVVNVLTMAFDTFYIDAPWSILRSLPSCVTLLFVQKLLLTWNRLVPVAIVVFRYMMVCHAIFCHNLGGEKVVWRRVTIVLVVFCLLNPLVVVFKSQDSLVFLWCMGRQETFR